MKKITTLSLGALFAGSIMLGGCATDTLTGPEAAPAYTEGSGGSNGGGTSGVGDHNTGNKTDDGTGSSSGSTSGTADHNTGN